MCRTNWSFEGAFVHKCNLNGERVNQLRRRKDLEQSVDFGHGIMQVQIFKFKIGYSVSLSDWIVRYNVVFVSRIYEIIFTWQFCTTFPIFPTKYQRILVC